ncbi:TonB-dependent receptor domain-containing protein [Asinibacterium sp. OR53]|uniref:TonB-dependent receptor domain-containing protein n=1 Tax=Asinibacterium sp. OR53 TaxID=925409 RepID=UPI0004BC5EC0|nr:TonB-dependent receptor [Asinibacterium sp. OR53]
MLQIVFVVKELYVFVAALFVWTLPVDGQSVHANAGSVKISGRVVDAQGKQGIEYVTISLVNNSTQKTIDGCVSDQKGNFLLPKVNRGTYKIVVQFIGYQDITQVVQANNDLQLGDMAMVKKSTTLGDVTVQSTRQLIVNKIDKLIYNVEKDITAQRGVATDALKKIPQVTVDADGNVELLGNPSIRFLIDGKPSSIFGNSVADALQSIPSSQIQSIEVITSPSAKYESAGTGGIINIILKKSKVEGMNASINLSAGTRLENGSLNANWKKHNIGINAYYSGNAQLNSQTPNGMDRYTTTASGNRRLLQQSAPDFSRDGYKTGIGFNWDLSKRDQIASAFGYNHFGNKGDGLINQASITYDLAGNEISRINSLRNFENHFSVNAFDNSLSYRHRFKKENQELEIAYEGSYSDNNTYYRQSQFYQKNDTAFAGSHSLNPGKENEVAFSVNYTHPLGEDAQLETGFRTSFESIISNADVYVLNGYTGLYAKDNVQSYTSDFRRTVYAGYAVASFPMFHKFLQIKAGTRFEYTVNRATYSNSGVATIPDYHNLAPSLIISHLLGNNQTIKFAYAYRIERPDYRDLNPFMNLSDPHNITTGNPNLQPEIGQNFQLGYNKSFDNGTNIDIVLYCQRNSPDIKPYITYYPSYKIGDSVYNDVTVTTRADISAEVRTGINIALSLPFGKKLTVRPNLMLFNRYLKNINADPKTLNSFGFRTNLNATYVISNQLTAEIFGNYYMGMKWQGKQPSAYSYTAAVRKQLFHNKGSVGIVIVNAFNQYIHQVYYSLAPNLFTNNYRDLPYRSFGISFMYKIGKLKFTKTKEQDNYLYSAPSEN